MSERVGPRVTLAVSLTCVGCPRHAPMGARGAECEETRELLGESGEVPDTCPYIDLATLREVQRTINGLWVKP